MDKSEDDRFSNSWSSEFDEKHPYSKRKDKCHNCCFGKCRHCCAPKSCALKLRNCNDVERRYCVEPFLAVIEWIRTSRFIKCFDDMTACCFKVSDKHMIYLVIFILIFGGGVVAISFVLIFAGWQPKVLQNVWMINFDLRKLASPINSVVNALTKRDESELLLDSLSESLIPRLEAVAFASTVFDARGLAMITPAPQLVERSGLVDEVVEKRLDLGDIGGAIKSEAGNVGSDIESVGGDAKTEAQEATSKIVDVATSLATAAKNKISNLASKLEMPDHITYFKMTKCQGPYIDGTNDFDLDKNDCTTPVPYMSVSFVDQFADVIEKFPVIGDAAGAALHFVSILLFVMINFHFIGLVGGGGFAVLMMISTIAYMIARHLHKNKVKEDIYSMNQAYQVEHQDPKSAAYIAIWCWRFAASSLWIFLFCAVVYSILEIVLAIAAGALSLLVGITTEMGWLFFGITWLQVASMCFVVGFWAKASGEGFLKTIVWPIYAPIWAVTCGFCCRKARHGCKRDRRMREQPENVPNYTYQWTDRPIPPPDQAHEGNKLVWNWKAGGSSEGWVVAGDGTSTYQPFVNNIPIDSIMPMAPQSQQTL